MPVKAVLFDVFGTLADLGQLPIPDVKLFFARVLRDAFALDAAGRFVPFREVAASALKVLGYDEGVLEQFPKLKVRDDAKAAFEHLRKKGLRVGTLSNGAPAVTRSILEGAGIQADEVISIEEIRRWKPRREVYIHGATRIGAPTGEVALVAAHAWDIHGAMQAGLKGVFTTSEEGMFAPAYGKPDITADSLLEAAQRVAP